MAVLVILDANVLMLTRKLNLDVFLEIEELVKTKVDFATTSTVIDELLGLSKRPGDIGRDADFALTRSEKCRIIRASVGDRGSVDDTVVKTAKENNAVVATADTKLRRKLRNAKIPVIFLREKSKLMIEGLEAAYY